MKRPTWTEAYLTVSLPILALTVSSFLMALAAVVSLMWLLGRWVH